MKILIHALGANMGGAIRHLHNFIPSLLKNDKTNQYVLILRNDVKFDFKDETLRIVRVPKYIGAIFLLRTFYDIIYLPIFAIKVIADLVVSLLNFGPIFCSKPHINFQRNSLYFCDYYLENIKGTQKFTTWMRSALVYLTMKYATVIVTPSNSMAEHIQSQYPSLRTKMFCTLYHGFKAEEKEQVKSQWKLKLENEKRIKILCPTHLAVHKGFDILFKALSLVKKDKNNFVLYATIDKADWLEGFRDLTSLINKLVLDDNVVLTGRIPQDEINVFYKNCDLMVYPSLCESFGFSMLEAMGYGLPIVAADTAINKEICKEAAIYYSALDPEDAAKKILSCFDTAQLQNLKNEAKKRFESFDWSWQRYAKEFIELVLKYG